MDSPPPPRWLELIGAPLLLLGPGGTQVLEVNMAFRRLAGALALPGLPCPLAALLGAGAEAALHAMVGGSPPGQFGSRLVTDCEVGGAQRSLALFVASLPAPRDHWLITLQEPAGTEAAPSPRWQQNLEAILSWLPVGVEILDDELGTVYANAHVGSLFGYTAQEVGHIEGWLELAFPDPAYRALALHSWQTAVAEARAANCEMEPQEWEVVCRDGSRKTIQYRYRSINGSDVVVYRDVSKERQLETELRRLAETDPLTGLLNRRQFFESAAERFRKAAGVDSDISILFLDLDHFKLVNDRHGHAIGDLALQATADRLRRGLRQGDLVARLGGEEFAVLLDGASQDAAWRVAERLRSAIAGASIEAGAQRLDLTVSIGGATRRADEQVEPLIERADRSLYAAKHAGRNCIFFEPAPDSPGS